MKLSLLLACLTLFAPLCRAQGTAPSTPVPAVTVSAAISTAAVQVSTATADSLFRLEYGVIKRLDFTPAQYPLSHVVLYYLPKSAEGKTNLKTLVVLHGGGEETAVSSAAVRVAIGYMKMMVGYAEANETALIAPTSAIGWNGKSQLMRRAVLAKARAELPLDPNGLYAWGHSMGGMGLSRDIWNENDEYAGFVINSAGMQPQTRESRQLYAYLNARIVHLQGKHDSFETFVPWTELEQSTMTALAAAEHMPLRYEAIFYEGTHQPDMPLLYATLDRLFKVPRNPYQKKIFVMLGYQPQNGDMKSYVYDGNFWLEAPKIPAVDKAYRLLARAEISSNAVHIDLHEYAGRLKTLRVYLSSQLVDLAKPVVIFVNGQKMAVRNNAPADYRRGMALAVKRSDTGLVFEDYIDVPLPDESVAR